MSDTTVTEAGTAGGDRNGNAAPRRRALFGVQPSEMALFLVLAAIFVALVVPPIASLVETALTDQKTGELTWKNFASIWPSLRRVDLIYNTFFFAIATTIVSFFFGSLMAWFAERTNAPFRRLAYISAFLSFALPTMIQVLGWVFLLGKRQGLINVVLVERIGTLSQPFDIQSMAGMIFVESILWSAVVFLLMVVPFRSMDSSLEEAGRVARGTGIEVFWRVTLKLAAPAGLGVILVSLVRNLEAFEVPAILGLPGGVKVLTTQIFTRLHATVLPNYSQVSAYSALLVLLVIPLLVAYQGATRGQGRYATITGKGLRTSRLDLGRYRWLAGIFMLILPVLIVLPILMLAWVSLLQYYQLPSVEALGSVSLDNYRALGAPNAGVLGSLFYTFAVAAGVATLVVGLSALACWVVVRTHVPGRSLLEFVSVVPLAVPGLVLGVGVLWAYVGSPLPVYGTVLIIIIAYMIRSIPFTMRSSHSGVLAISKELEESAFVAGASRRETLQRVFVPLMLPALFAGWQFSFLQTARELPVALLLQSQGNKMASVVIWNLWEVGQVTSAAALSVIVAVLLGGFGWLLETMSRRLGITSADAGGH